MSTHLQAFYKLVEHVQITAVVKVVFRYEQEKSAHIVVVGPTVVAFNYALAYRCSAWASHAGTH